MLDKVDERVRVFAHLLNESHAGTGASVCEHSPVVMLVGGAVRDMMRNQAPKDNDIEVFGITSSALETFLTEHCEKVDCVGASFGIYKVIFNELDIDVSLPRRDSKCGEGHKGFSVSTDSDMTVSEAASRRDFTVNAMSLNLMTGEIVDPFNGRDDLTLGLLRHTSEHFGEDPLRVLRGMQFAARMRMQPTYGTACECLHVRKGAQFIAPERIWIEWEKFLTKGISPTMGLEFLRESGWLQLYPELDALQRTEQHPEWHMEGDVWTHTLLACEHVWSHGGTVSEKLAVLCHDMGKPSTTLADFTSKGHAEQGVEIARQFLGRIHCPSEIIKSVLPLVREHMCCFQQDSTKSAVRRLAVRLAPATIESLCRVIRADQAGAICKHPHSDCANWIENMAAQLNVSSGAPKPILMGRHLIEMGVKPGPTMGQILKKVFEAQLEGSVSTLEDALNMVKESK